MIQVFNGKGTSTGVIGGKVDSDKVKRSLIILRSIYHPMRRRIYDLLDQHGELSVTDLIIILRRPQAVVSQHLAIMRQANIVMTHKEGKSIIYSINYDMIHRINKALKHLK